MLYRIRVRLRYNTHTFSQFAESFAAACAALEQQFTARNLYFDRSSFEMEKRVKQ